MSQRTFDKSKQVLVLNKHWAPINVIPMRRAMRLLFSMEQAVKDHQGNVLRPAEPKARILDPRSDFNMYTWEDWSRLKPKEGYDTIEAGNSVFRAPKVILLSRHDKLPPLRPKFNRRKIYERDEYRCQYCGRKLPGGELTLDHVTPKCQGGLTTWENIVLACIKCNSRKAGRTPEQANMKLLKKPIKPKISGLYKGGKGYIPEDWMSFLSEVYWETELVNDN